jgi:uncharacterized protein YxjI
MHELLNRNLFLVKEHIGIFKAANNYDVYDPESGQIILHCREDTLGPLTKLLRFSKYKPNTPFDVRLRTPDGEELVRVSRGWAWIRSEVAVHDHRGELLGTFKQKLLSLGGRFDVHDPDDTFLCKLQGEWTSWEFRFLAEEVEFAHVTKQWTGLGKELFTSADNYALEISDSVPPDHPLRQLILGAVMVIDMVLKERGG